MSLRPWPELGGARTTSTGPGSCWLRAGWGAQPPSSHLLTPQGGLESALGERLEVGRATHRHGPCCRGDVWGSHSSLRVP